MSEKFNVYEFYSQIEQENILLSYKGPVTDFLLTEFSNDIRTQLREERKAGKKVFSIFMELAQNVLYYSREMDGFDGGDKVGILAVIELDTCYKVMTGNMIPAESVPQLVAKCKKINSLDRDALRAYKRELRDSPPHSGSKGAGIGLVQVALTANNVLDAHMEQTDKDHYMFVLTVTVPKQ
ncbi:SiaB family protein kinase [Microscilla marina]|uniref:GHKL domain-containing protein n=1 Tax=Microscilla marina ATCC 23134 TaxID=313606 RepID=A1ZY18_MICM2|nr:SiaB family protein kinase [Microscilla marina]EAY24755.1 conserved hypothetical protein [Microscilla marina ATCC 23134]